MVSESVLPTDKEESIEEIIRKYSNMLYRICIVILGNEFDAEEALQDRICVDLNGRIILRLKL